MHLERAQADHLKVEKINHMHCQSSRTKGTLKKIHLKIVDLHDLIK
jgi:hypothetical protein